MSYISPIKIGYAEEPEEGWTDKIGRYIAGEVDNLVLESCVKVGCHVDKDELEKALRYDRGQYEKGYEDGKRAAAAAIEALQAKLGDRINQDEQDKIREYLRNAPVGPIGPIEPMRIELLTKHGEWVEDTTTYAGPGLSNYKCSLCGKICGTWRRGLEPSELPNWCGNCGADMRKMEVQINGFNK